eukprot:Skav202170  [mRNA]  locus=scaffold482:9512:22783:+ [translate_table: standard]
MDPFAVVEWHQEGQRSLADPQDLSHAEDEVTFYEEALALKRQPGVAGLGPLLSYTLEYAGVLTHAGWQGKSRVAALRQSMVDGITNSSCEGFRLEGFDGRPPALESMDPLLDLGMTGNAKMAKKAPRGAEAMPWWSDVPEAQLQTQLSATEVAEVVCHEAERSCWLRVVRWLWRFVNFG